MWVYALRLIGWLDYTYAAFNVTIRYTGCRKKASHFKIRITQHIFGLEIWFIYKNSLKLGSHFKTGGS